jgi:mRNA interferase RelE/StbE
VAAYSIFIRKSAVRELEALAKKDLRKVLERIEALGENPRPAGAEKLAGVELWRIRQGNYRIVYSIEDDALTVWVVKVGHRKEVYRKIKDEG